VLFRGGFFRRLGGGHGKGSGGRRIGAVGTGGEEEEGKKREEAEVHGGKGEGSERRSLL
jgi:hypothetical protein